MADQDKMSPDSSPAAASKSGVRRINKRPLYIGLGVALLFCLVVAYVANKRSQQNISPLYEKFSIAADKNAPIHQSLKFNSE